MVASIAINWPVHMVNLSDGENIGEHIRWNCIGLMVYLPVYDLLDDLRFDMMEVTDLIINQLTDEGF